MKRRETFLVRLTYVRADGTDYTRIAYDITARGTARAIARAVRLWGKHHSSHILLSATIGNSIPWLSGEHYALTVHAQRVAARTAILKRDRRAMHAKGTA